MYETFSPWSAWSIVFVPALSSPKKRILAGGPCQFNIHENQFMKKILDVPCGSPKPLYAPREWDSLSHDALSHPRDVR